MRTGEIPELIRSHEIADNCVYLSGPPGCAKSSIISQMCAEDGVENIDIRLALMNPVDLRGIPVVMGDRVVWVQPEFLVKKGRCRFFLDELPNAPPATQATAYQWILDNRIGEWRMDRTLDKNGRPAQTIVAAGNRATDQAFVHQMPAPLRNRFAHVEVEVNYDDWREWAYKAAVDRYVINFLAFTSRIGVDAKEIKGAEMAKQGLLFFFDPKQHSTGAFPTPRSWHQVSRFITKAPKYRYNAEAIAGMVGGPVATKFVAFLRVADQLPNAEDVAYKGKLAILPPKEPSAQYAYCGALASAVIRAKKEDRAVACQNVAAYCAKHWENDAEFAVLTMKDIGRTPEYKEVYKSVIVTPEWKGFTKSFGDLLEV